MRALVGCFGVWETGGNEKGAVMDHARLRPIERCVLRMSSEGMPDAEIGRRLNRSAEHVGRVRDLTAVPRSSAPTPSGRPADPLRPLERRVLRWLDQGSDRFEVALAFRRTPTFVDLVEQMARYKLDVSA